MNRLGSALLAAALLSLVARSSQAVAPRPGKALPQLVSTSAVRHQRAVSATVPSFASVAWRPLASANFHAVWDTDTGVPANIWFPSIAVPGAMTDPAIAERAARDFLDAHLAVLAPGASKRDFVLVSNITRDDLRTVAFRQVVDGVPVLGGAIRLSFKHDNLFVGGSQALPNVAIAAVRGRLDDARLAASATGWLAQDLGATTQATPTGTRVVLPLVAGHDAQGPLISYRLVDVVETRSTVKGAPGLWNVYVDAATGAAIARRDRLHFATGTLTFNVGQRQPTVDRIEAPAALLHLTVDSGPFTTDAAGVITWATAVDTSLGITLVGTVVRILNEAGANASTTLALADGGSVSFGDGGNEQLDAQVSSYIYANQVKAFVKANINPDLAYLDDLLDVHVNEAGQCNAYSTGDDLHFFPADAECENTGRLADVVYHEFGHSLHQHSMTNGLTEFDAALSEGLADYTAAMITGDEAMGRGFFHNNDALRELDPPDYEFRWPDDQSDDPHATGQIISGALWDARLALIAEGHDPAAAVVLANKLYYGVMQRAVDIPSSFVEALTADDDNGNLIDGTPHQCTLTQTFGRHGLVMTDFPQTIAKVPVVTGTAIDIEVDSGESVDCPPPAVTGATASWSIRGDTATGQVDLLPGGGLPTVNHYSGFLPTQPDGTVMLYTVRVDFSDGTHTTFPKNAADPQYQMFFGTRVPIWCEDFEGATSKFSFSATGAAPDWEVAAPGSTASDDPTSAHGGSKMMGTDITFDGLYSSSADETASTPAIDTTRFTGVRLQYWRWLNVEDGTYDQASITADGAAVWSNLVTPSGSTNHRDAEWRFQDIDLSAQAADGSVTLAFNLTSDQGAEFGGWNIDDVCVVGIQAAPRCGDGVMDPGEQCDDHNLTDGDGCSATCETEMPATMPDGCCSTSTDPGSTLALGALAGLLVLRPRRRRRA